MGELITTDKNNDNYLIPFSELSIEKQEKITDLVKTINTTDPNSILNYGVDVQTKLGSSGDLLLEGVRTDKSGEVGESILSLLDEIGQLDTSDLNQNMVTKFLSKIPIIGKYTNKAVMFSKKFDSVASNIGHIVTTMDQSRLNIIKDNAKLEALYTMSVTEIYELEDLIQALQIKIEELNQELLDSEVAGESKITLGEKNAVIYRLEKRLHAMMLTRTVTVQSLPQIIIITGNNITLAENIRSTIDTTIPVWKRQVAMALSLDNQKKASDIQQLMNEATATMLKKNADNLKTNSIQIATQNEEAIIDVATLEYLQTNLIETMSKVNEIKERGTADRKLVLGKLTEIKKVLE